MSFSIQSKDAGIVVSQIQQKYAKNAYVYIAQFYGDDGKPIEGSYELKNPENMLLGWVFEPIPHGTPPEKFFKKLARDGKNLSREGYLVVCRHRDGVAISYEYADLEKL